MRSWFLRALAAHRSAPFGRRPSRTLRSLAVTLPLVLGTTGVLGTTSSPADARALAVVTSIAPVQSLASALVGDDGTVSVLVPPGASPHTYSLKPSDAASLARADVIFWIGPAMETFLPRILETVPKKATIVTLDHVPGAHTLPLREGGVWGHHHHHHGDDQDHEDHDDHEHHDEDTGHDHEDHAADHTQNDHHGDDHHGDDHHDHDQHDHDMAEAVSVDPHQWMDPNNARAWVHAMTLALSQADPAHTDAYRQREKALDQRLSDLHQRLQATLAPVAGVPYLVFHDAYHYLEDRYGLTAVGALSIDPGQPLGARRLAELRQEVERSKARCVFAEPQFSDALPKVVSEGSDADVAIADPLGRDIPPGPDHYFLAMQSLADAMRECLSHS